MKKKIVTVSIGDRPHAPKCLDSQRAFADRVGADLVVLDDPDLYDPNLHPTPAFVMFSHFADVDLIGDFDRALWLHDDVEIGAKAPDVFEIEGELLAKPHDWRTPYNRAYSFRRWVEDQLGWKIAIGGTYFDDSVFVIDRKVATLLDLVCVPPFVFSKHGGASHFWNAIVATIPAGAFPLHPTFNLTASRDSITTPGDFVHHIGRAKQAL